MLKNKLQVNYLNVKNKTIKELELVGEYVFDLKMRQQNIWDQFKILSP